MRNWVWKVKCSLVWSLVELNGNILHTVLPDSLTVWNCFYVLVLSCKVSLIISVLCFFRYIQSLTNNLSFVRYKDIYAAAAEIIGLILKNMTAMENVCVFPESGWITVLSQFSVICNTLVLFHLKLHLLFSILFSASSRTSQSCCK